MQLFERKVVKTAALKIEPYPADFLMIQHIGEITGVEPDDVGGGLWNRQQIEGLLGGRSTQVGTGEPIPTIEIIPYTCRECGFPKTFGSSSAMLMSTPTNAFSDSNAEPCVQDSSVLADAADEVDVGTGATSVFGSLQSSLHSVRLASAWHEPHSIPVDAESWPQFVRTIIEDHLREHPKSDLVDVLTGQKSLQAALGRSVKAQGSGA